MKLLTLSLIINMSLIIQLVFGEATSLISFQPLGQHVSIGLDFEMPFLQVPIKRNAGKNGNSTAMVNINTASLITSGLLAGASTIVAHTIRSFNSFHSNRGEFKNKIFKANPNETNFSRRKQYRNDELSKNGIHNIFDHLKLVYRSATSHKVETTLPDLFSSIKEINLNNSVDIEACVQKSFCLLVYESSKSVREGKGTSLQKIIDGISSYAWFVDVLVPNQDLRRALHASKTKEDNSCTLAYPTCKWSASAIQLVELLKSHIKFI